MKSLPEVVMDMDIEAFRSLKASSVGSFFNVSIIQEDIGNDRIAVDIAKHIGSELRKRVRSEARHAAH